MTDRLAGKIALVFGAGCIEDEWGNGNATAVAYAREGARVVCVDVNFASAERTVGLIVEAGGEGIAIRADVTSHAEISAAVAQTVAHFGRIDILHNNVGTNAPGGPVEMSEVEWDRVFDVNVKSIFWTCKEVLPIMQAQGGGSIINVSSIVSITWTGHPMISYHASKAAVNQFTRAVAMQYAAQGIRCNAILPGFIETPRVKRHVLPFFHGNIEKMRESRSRSVPQKRLGSPWDIAHAAVYLASDEASYVTGLIMPVDGGLSCSAPHDQG